MHKNRKQCTLYKNEAGMTSLLLVGLVSIVLVTVAGIGSYVAMHRTAQLNQQALSTTNTQRAQSSAGAKTVQPLVTSKTSGKSTSTVKKPSATANTQNTVSTSNSTSTNTTTNNLVPLQTYLINNSDNGKTIPIANNIARVVVQLSSTFWSFSKPTNTAVVQMNGSTAYDPTPGAPPGTGEGTSSQSYTVVGPGSVTLSAQASSCGEAVRCVNGAQFFSVTLVVSPKS